MILPVEKITYPACLAGQQNGQLPAALLVSTPGLAGGPVVRLVPPAARAWQALTAAALQAGHTLKATSPADSYRPYAQQYATFVARYEPDPFPGSIGARWWPAHLDLQGNQIAGRMWYQKPNTAVAAVPGTSNHGLGLAVDTGEEIDGDAGTESLDDVTLAWLVANEYRFGFSHEVQSERWHIHYFAGDAIPAAVLEHERGDDMPQCLIRYTDDSIRDRVWLADRMTRRVVASAELVDAGSSATFLAAVIAGTAVANGPVADVGQFVGGPLSNGGKVYQTSGYAGPNRDAWGAEYPPPGDGAPPFGPVDLTEEAVAKVADAVVDEQHDRLAE